MNRKAAWGILAGGLVTVAYSAHAMFSDYKQAKDIRKEFPGITRLSEIDSETNGLVGGRTLNASVAIETYLSDPQFRKQYDSLRKERIKLQENKELVKKREEIVDLDNDSILMGVLCGIGAIVTWGGTILLREERREK